MDIRWIKKQSGRYLLSGPPGIEVEIEPTGAGWLVYQNGILLRRVKTLPEVEQIIIDEYENSVPL